METDTAVKSECTPDGYKMFSTSRPDRKGESIALICRSNMTVREVFVKLSSCFCVIRPLLAFHCIYIVIWQRLPILPQNCN